MFKYIFIAIFIIACEDNGETEIEILLKEESSKQDSIQNILNSINKREEAQKNLLKNVAKICHLQLIELENGHVEDSLRLAEFTVKMKLMYPDTDRQVLRRVAMKIESCEEYRVKAANKRKNTKKR